MEYSLIRSLRAAGKKAEAVEFPDGSRIVLLPYGGRVLGLFAGGDPQNFFWVNPALLNRASACAFFTSHRWQNTGGQRTWLAPEISFFFPRFPDLSNYVQPSPLDAGTFHLSMDDGCPSMASEFTVRSHRDRTDVQLRLRKSFEPAPNPLRAEDHSPAGVLAFAGYTVRTMLEFAVRSVRPVMVGSWSITQLPPGGTMFVPTYGRVEPRIFFGKILRKDLRVGRNWTAFRMYGAGDHKMGMRIHSITGRVGYHYESAGSANLVIQNFFANPSGEYVDAPWSDPTDKGYGIEACCVCNPELGAFGELEYHTPAIGGDSGTSRSDEVAQIWAYRGEPAQIRHVAECLLGIPPRVFARHAGSK